MGLSAKVHVDSNLTFMDEALVYYVLSNVLMRHGLLRVVAQLYSRRFAINSAVAFLFDACASKVLVDESIGTAIALRLLCVFAFLAGSG